LRTNVTYTDFYIAVDVVGWDDSLDQAFGILARVREPGLGTTDGYALSYQTGNPGNPGLQISVITNEVPSMAQPTNNNIGTVRLSPTNTYRLVFLGRGTNLEGRVYLASDLSHPLENLSAIPKLPMVEGHLERKLDRLLKRLSVLQGN